MGALTSLNANKELVQMDLSDTKICIDCELLFNWLLTCPRCGSTSWQWLARWIVPTQKRRQYEA